MGEHLRRLQTELKISSQEKMAVKVGISQGMLSKYMNDEKPIPFQTAIYISIMNKRPDFMSEWLNEINKLAWNEVYKGLTA